MTFATGAGSIVIAGTLSSGRVCAVEIRSSRPVGIARMFRGRPIEEVPILAERLFTLCGFAHAVAARLAIDAALSRRPSPAMRFAHSVGLIAERIAETLRSCVLGWPLPQADHKRLAEAIVPLREAMAAARELTAAARAGLGVGVGAGPGPGRGGLAPVVERLAAAAGALGLAGPDGADLRPRSFLAKLAADTSTETAFLRQAPDALTVADDVAVAAALRSGGVDFAHLPALPRRRIETGAYARRWRDMPAAASPLSARLQARLADVARGLTDLRGGLETGEIDDAELAHFGQLDGGAFAAVESPRGRLYHYLELEEDSRIGVYEMLAPTEWNLHPAGPLAAALLGTRVGTGEAARLRIARLAALFDPCVSFRVDCKETADA